MGLISFVKNAGASIFGGSEAKAAPADELKKELDKHGLDHSDVKVDVEGDKVKVSGLAKSTKRPRRSRSRSATRSAWEPCKTTSSPPRPHPSRGSTQSSQATRSGRSPSGNTAGDKGRNTTSSSRPTARC